MKRILCDLENIIMLWTYKGGILAQFLRDFHEKNTENPCKSLMEGKGEEKEDAEP